MKGSPRDAGKAGEIGMASDAAEAAALEQPRDCVLLGAAVLEQQPATALRCAGASR